MGIKIDRKSLKQDADLLIQAVIREYSHSDMIRLPITFREALSSRIAEFVEGRLKSQEILITFPGGTNERKQRGTCGSPK